jgi:hypothetical protein
LSFRFSHLGQKTNSENKQKPQICRTYHAKNIDIKAKISHSKFNGTVILLELTVQKMCSIEYPFIQNYKIILLIIIIRLKSACITHMIRKVNKIKNENFYR